MSWCRWSSDNFACDLYVYDGYDGTVVHVARRRYEFDRTGLPEVDHSTPDRFARSLVNRWTETRRRLHEESRTVPIYLPHAGTSRVFATPADAADWIDELAALGYQVPDGLTDDMRSECEA